MKYIVITKKTYNKTELMFKINELFLNDNDELADTNIFLEYMDYIFDKSKNNKSFLILLEENEKIVSMVNFFEYNDIENFWVECTLFVKKEYRNKGYAKLILHKALNTLEKYRCNKLICGIKENNQNSIKFHLSNNFLDSGLSWDRLEQGFPLNHKGFVFKK